MTLPDLAVLWMRRAQGDLRWEIDLPLRQVGPGRRGDQGETFAAGVLPDAGEVSLPVLQL